MKITEEQLRQIIKEEVSKAMNEASVPPNHEFWRVSRELESTLEQLAPIVSGRSYRIGQVESLMQLRTLCNQVIELLNKAGI